MFALNALLGCPIIYIHFVSKKFLPASEVDISEKLLVLLLVVLSLIQTHPFLAKRHKRTPLEPLQRDGLILVSPLGQNCIKVARCGDFGNGIA